MAEYSNYQKKVIQRYYDNRETIALQKLGELVTELYLATSDKKKDQLWSRVETQMKALKVGPKLAEHILNRRDAKLLADNLQDWMKSPPR